MQRRHLLSLLPLWAAAPAVRAAAAEPASAPRDDSIHAGRVLRFPADHGAHPGARTEWWYLTGHLHAPGAPADAAPAWGFQVTFFRSRTGLAADLPGRFAPRQLLFAHAALTELGTSPRHRHDQRLARWDGQSSTVRDHAALADCDLALAGWTLQRRASDGAFLTRLQAEGFSLDLALRPTQPLLLQGEQGHSRKGPRPSQASLYVSQPQLAASGQVATASGPQAVAGTAWLDHEWSDELLPPEAEGWDWIGMNLFDGSALTAFRLRGREGAPPVWAGGSHRAAGGAARPFAPDEVQFEPEQPWTSPATGARYPLRWRLRTPTGGFTVQALFNAQELDSRASTGTVYWEGLSELLDDSGRRVGLGYLEMTGYSGRLRL